MPDDNTSDEPQAQPAEPASDPDPDPEPSWPDVTETETRGADPGDFRFKTRD